MLLPFVSGLLIFVVLVCCTFFPYFYLIRRDQNRDKHTISLSLCNCVACGVFLSTCFLGLVPHVRYQEELIRRKHAEGNLSNHGTADSQISSLSTETIVLLGFLMILVIEQITFVCSNTDFTTKMPAQPNALPSLRSLLDGETEDGRPLVDTALDDHDNSMQDIEFRSPSPLDRDPRHVMHSHVPPPRNGISARTLFLLFGLSTHSLFEGVALGVQHNMDDFMNILIAVMFHEVLCCIAYGVSMAQQQTPVRAALPTVLILSASIPAGILIAVLVDQINPNTVFLRFILEGLAAGTFVYVACVGMLSAELNSSHGHSHIGIQEEHGVHSAPHSPLQGLAKAAAVVFGVFLFWMLKFARSSHS
ncbi:hypothetical protein KIN20_009419 [Parelaphostrongylus tenuis]|uniref:Uncharacterized protein n=1 Tax=Parelaphostrongylus tenuis TaxID=148309 RepID=A0AAD5QKN6_PARTN|nr:hypothetical protein KIN20_009419 [Parelaphostrongylus tenuis]